MLDVPRRQQGFDWRIGCEQVSAIDFVELVMLSAKIAIDLQQFQIGKPIWETYLKGQESDPKVAMQKVVDAVHAEMKKG